MTALAEGWSKTRVAGSRTPVAVLSRLRTSTALSESKPSSRKARCGSIASGPAWPRTAAAWVRTRSRTIPARSCAGTSASRAASAEGLSSPGCSAAVSSSLTSGRSAMRGRERCAVKAVAKRSQSMSATTPVVSSCSTARTRAATASSGVIGRRPRRST